MPVPSLTARDLGTEPRPEFRALATSLKSMQLCRGSGSPASSSGLAESSRRANHTSERPEARDQPRWPCRRQSTAICTPG